VPRLLDYLLEPAAPRRDGASAEAMVAPQRPRRPWRQTDAVAAPARARRSPTAAVRATLAEWLAPEESPVRDAAPAVAPAAAVVGAAAEAAALGAALALVLARRNGSSAAVLCLAGTSPPAWHAPAVPAARRMCGALRARGLPARASGRLAIVPLAAAASEAALEAGRTFAAAGAGSAAVLVLGGPRDSAFDALLARVDVALAAVPAAAPGSLAALAVAGLEAAGPRTVAAAQPLTGVGSALAAAGVLVPPGVRRALVDACEPRP
jgi:hypothetical protein